MRSPVGSEAERSGDSSSTRWRVELATSFASLRHQSKSAKAMASRRQPSWVSRKATPGWLMQSSVTSCRESKGRSARRFRSRAEAVPAMGASMICGFELIDGPEVEISGNEHLNAIALGFGNGRRDIDGALQHLRHDVLRGRWVEDHGAAVTLRG